MHLLKQILTKGMELQEEFHLNRNPFKSIWVFYNHSYALALELTGREDKRIKIKNRLWKKFVNKFLDGNFDLVMYSKFKKFIKEDMVVVIEAIRIIDKNKESGGLVMGDLDKPYYVAILSYDYPSD